MVKSEEWQELGTWLGHLASLCFMAVVIVVLLALCSGCATYDAVVGAPPEFWLTAETIVLAILQDIYDLIDLLT